MENVGKRVFTDVIIPSYNCENTLERTVESIINSGLKSFDIILVDDGSTDKTPALCDALSEKFENVLCIHKKNGGVSSARNEGIRAAKGEYLLFFDSDDTAECGAFSEAEKILTEKSPDMLIFGMSFDYYKNGKMYRRDELVYEKEGLFSKKELIDDFQELYICNALSSSCNKFFKKSIIDKNAILFDEKMIILEDFEFSLKNICFCENFYCLKKALYHYKQPENEKKILGRLKKIPQASEYIKPIENDAELLKSSRALSGGDAENVDKVIRKLFFMLLRQKVFLASFGQVKLASQDFKSSKYTSFINELFGRDRDLCTDVLNCNVFKVMLATRLQFTKNLIVNFLKRLNLYDRLKGALK